MLKNAKFLMKVSTNSTSLSFKLRPGISESETAAWRQHTLSTYMLATVITADQYAFHSYSYFKKVTVVILGNFFI